MSDDASPYDLSDQRHPAAMRPIKGKEAMRMTSELLALRQYTDEIERLRARLAEAERDAARYRWLRSRYLAADFAYGDPPCCAIVFEMPNCAAFTASCDDTIDGARVADSAADVL